MKHLQFSSALVAGLGGTLAMTLMMLMAPMMGMPAMDIGGMLAKVMGMPVAVGWLAHLMIGVLLAIGYGALFVPVSGLRGLHGGLAYSLIPWLMAQLIVMPMMGMGLFSGSMTLAMGSLVGHLLYGAELGALYRPGPQPAAENSSASPRRSVARS